MIVVRLFLLFVVAAALSVLVTLLELGFFLAASGYAAVATLAAFNLLLVWAIIGLLWTWAGLAYAAQPAPKDSARAWVGRAATQSIRVLMRVLLVAASTLLILLLSWVVGVTSSEWPIHLIEAVAWPAVVAVALVVIVTTRSGAQLFKSLSARLQKVSAFGVDLELTAEVAQQVQNNVETSFAEYRTRINLEFDRQVRQRRIDDLLAAIVDQSMREVYSGGPAVPPDWKQQEPETYRCTIHVEDVLLHGALYQLLDYYPSGLGHGRAFSSRYGIIGKAWRLVDDQREGSVDFTADNLINAWAMTRSESREAEQKGVTSFVCAVLKDQQDLPVGILYFDSKDENAFGPENQMRRLADVARGHCGTRNLTRAIIDVGNEMRKVGPALTFFK